jgi:hypothetical protein
MHVLAIRIFAPGVTLLKLVVSLLLADTLAMIVCARRNGTPDDDEGKVVEPAGFERSRSTAAGT